MRQLLLFFLFYSGHGPCLGRVVGPGAGAASEACELTAFPPQTRQGVSREGDLPG